MPLGAPPHRCLSSRCQITAPQRSACGVSLSIALVSLRCRRCDVSAAVVVAVVVLQPEEKEKAEKMFMDVGQAYEVLSDPGSSTPCPLLACPSCIAVIDGCPLSPSLSLTISRSPTLTVSPSLSHSLILPLSLSFSHSLAGVVCRDAGQVRSGRGHFAAGPATAAARLPRLPR
jgi:hypothetical protein